MNVHPHGEKISAYIDDMLDVAQMRDIAQHLRVCGTCRETCEGLQQTRDLIRNLSAPPALSSDFWTHTYRRVRVDSAQPGMVISLRERLRQTLLGTQRRWAARAAAVAVLGAIIAAPSLNHNASFGTHPAALSATADVVDFPALVRDHTQSAARQPLADSDRQTMLSADVDDISVPDDTGTEVAANGLFTSDSSH